MTCRLFMTVPPYCIICSVRLSVVIVWLSLLPYFNSYYSHVHHFHTNSHTTHTLLNHNLHKTIEYCLHSYFQSNDVLHNISLFITLYPNCIEYNLPLIIPYSFLSLIIYLTTYSSSFFVRGYVDLKVFFHRYGICFCSKIFVHYYIIKATSFTNIAPLLLPCYLSSVNNDYLNILCWVSVQIVLLYLYIVCHNG